MTASKIERIRALVRDVPDFPKPGVCFKDITPVLAHAEALADVVELMAGPYTGQKIDVVCGIESRGFILGTPLAMRLGAGFVPIRKPGKLPRRTVSVPYELEYGSDAVEMHADALARGQRVLLCDDVIATGGTAAACVELIAQLGALCVGAGFLMELSFLQGAAKLGPLKRSALLTY